MFMTEGSLNLYGKSKPAVLHFQWLMCVSMTWLELKVAVGSKQAPQPKSQKHGPVPQILVICLVGISTKILSPLENISIGTTAEVVARCWLWACLKLQKEQISNLFCFQSILIALFPGADRTVLFSHKFSDSDFIFFNMLGYLVFNLPLKFTSIGLTLGKKKDQCKMNIYSLPFLGFCFFHHTAVPSCSVYSLRLHYIVLKESSKGVEEF